MSRTNTVIYRVSPEGEIQETVHRNKSTPSGWFESLEGAKAAHSAWKIKRDILVTAFKKDLKLLLEKHEALIGFSVSESSYVWGLSEERMIVGIHTTSDYYEGDLAEGWCVKSTDLD